MRMDLKQMSELLGYTLEHENQEIKNLVYDSRQVTKGSVFFAIKGQDSDGHQYIEDAVRNGAIAVVGEESLNPGVYILRCLIQKKRWLLFRLSFMVSHLKI